MHACAYRHHRQAASSTCRTRAEQLQLRPCILAPTGRQRLQRVEHVQNSPNPAHACLCLPASRVFNASNTSRAAPTPPKLVCAHWQADVSPLAPAPLQHSKFLARCCPKTERRSQPYLNTGEPRQQGEAVAMTTARRSWPHLNTAPGPAAAGRRMCRPQRSR